MRSQKIVIADDDPVGLRLLEALVTSWGCGAVSCRNGLEAWAALEQFDAPALAILDWVMPGLDGVEVCRRVRQTRGTETPAYLILLTANERPEDIVAGLGAGADDYVTKPFDPHELRARVQVGMRVVDLQHALADRVRELEEALAQVKLLRGLLPICTYCKKIRDDQNYWEQVDGYLARHADMQFSHGICPDCFDRIVEPELKGVEGK